MMTAPASRSRAATNESCGGMEPSNASDPAVVVIRSCVSMLSLSATGMPCSGPRTFPAARSASSSSAIASASGFVSMIERSSGPCPSSASMRSRYSSRDRAGRALARRHARLELVDRHLVQFEGRHRRCGARVASRAGGGIVGPTLRRAARGRGHRTESSSNAGPDEASSIDHGESSVMMSMPRPRSVSLSAATSVLTRSSSSARCASSCSRSSAFTSTCWSVGWKSAIASAPTR